MDEADLADLGARLGARHPAIGFYVGPPTDDGWLTIADLVDGDGQPTATLDSIVDATAADFPPDATPATRTRVSAQRFCYLWGWSVAAASLGSLLLEGVAPDPAADNVAVCVHGHYPGEVTFLGPSTGTDATWWEERLLADHLDLLHAAVARRWRLGRRGLRGDLATDVAGVGRTVGDLTGDPTRAAEATRDVLDRPRSRLRGLGVVRVAGDDTRQAVVYERNTCCLVLKVDPDAICSNCPLLTPEARDAALQARVGGGGRPAT